MSSKKVVLITGASSGIGKAAAKDFLAENKYIVYTAARRVEKMEDIKELGAIPIKMDISKEEDIVRVVEQIKSENSGVDILVNNAGFGLFGTIEDVSIEKAKYQFEVNIFGLARLTQLIIPHMRANRWGRIINTSSVGGRVSLPLGGWYHATKYALEALSDCLRMETSGFGIDVVLIEPGAIGTEFGEVMDFGSPEKIEKSAYSGMYKSMQKLFSKMGSKSNAFSPPTVISAVILKAASVRRPKTRYLAGKMAKLLIFTKKMTTDRMFDKILKGFMGTK